MLRRHFVAAAVLFASPLAASNKNAVMEQALKGCVIDMMTHNAPDYIDISGEASPKGFYFSAIGKPTTGDRGFGFTINFDTGHDKVPASASLTYYDREISPTDFLSIKGQPGTLSSRPLTIPSSFAKVDAMPSDIVYRERTPQNFFKAGPGKWISATRRGR